MHKGHGVTYEAVQKGGALESDRPVRVFFPPFTCHLTLSKFSSPPEPQLPILENGATVQ